METNGSLREIYLALKKAIERKKNFIIIENPKSGKFVQFELDHYNKKIIMDIPLIKLTNLQLEKINNELRRGGVRPRGQAMEYNIGEIISIQEYYNFEQIKKASKMVDKIFRDIFNLPKDYKITSQIFS